MDSVGMMKANDELLLNDNAFINLNEAKSFAKGIKFLGKNFHRLNQEFLPLHHPVLLD